MKSIQAPLNRQLRLAGKKPDFTGLIQMQSGLLAGSPDPGSMPDHKIRLTDLETEVLFLIVDGFADEKIAERLMESPSVIHATHRNLLFKMEVHNDAMLVREAFRGGFVW